MAFVDSAATQSFGDPLLHKIDVAAAPDIVPLQTELRDHVEEICSLRLRLEPNNIAITHDGQGLTIRLSASLKYAPPLPISLHLCCSQGVGALSHVHTKQTMFKDERGKQSRQNEKNKVKEEKEKSTSVMLSLVHSRVVYKIQGAVESSFICHVPHAPSDTT